MAHRVFVSYSREDRKTAESIVAGLEAAGIRCWIDHRDISPGNEWRESIIQAITSSRAMILILSQGANASRDVSQEVGIAFDEKIAIIPVRIDNSTPSPSLRYCLAGTHWLDMAAEPSRQDIVKLSGAVRQAGEVPLTSSPNEENLEDCIALCLSGGGYRAMLFHLGVAWYLNDAGYLQKLARISSVSGGSITSGVLALAWPRLSGSDPATAFRQHVVGPLRRMASTTIDTQSVLGGVFMPDTVSERLIKRYKDLLFGDRTLQDLPDMPRFVINATSVQTGSLMRFSKPYISDWQVGIYPNPRTSLAEAVAASSAFPPVLSPVQIKFNPGDFRGYPQNPESLHRPPYTTEAMLTDGGVYDNMGIETAWKRCRTILVSDAGEKMQPEEKPAANWASHSLRINSLIDNQVRSLRKRQVVAAFKKGDRSGTYWGMWTDPAEYPAESRLALPVDMANELARTPTRLQAIPEELQERLINFGFGMAERAIRSFFDKDALAAAGFPYPRGI